MINTIKVGTSVHNIVPVLSERVYGNSLENPLRLGTSGSGDLYGLTIAVGSGITAGAGGLYIDAQWPFVADSAYGLYLKLNFDKSGLSTDAEGLKVRVGTGLAVDSGGVSVVLRDNGGITPTVYGLALELGSDTYTDGAVIQHRSLDTTYGLHLRLSTYTKKKGITHVRGNALCSTEYGLTLALGTSLTVEADCLDVALSPYTLLKQDGEMVRAIPYSSLGLAVGGIGQGGLALCLNLRDIRGNGTLQSLLTVDEGGALDIDVEALKYVLGLS